MAHQSLTELEVGVLHSENVDTVLATISKFCWHNRIDSDTAAGSESECSMASSEIPEGLEELFEQTWFDHALHYGLLIGAIFQLVCIAAVVLLPLKPEEESDGYAENSSPGGSSKGMFSSEGTGDTTGGGAATTGGVSGSKKGGKKARKRK